MKFINWEPKGNLTKVSPYHCQSLQFLISVTSLYVCFTEPVCSWYSHIEG